MVEIPLKLRLWICKNRAYTIYMYLCGTKYMYLITCHVPMPITGIFSPLLKVKNLLPAIIIKDFFVFINRHKRFTDEMEKLGQNLLLLRWDLEYKISTQLTLPAPLNHLYSYYSIFYRFIHFKLNRKL